MAFAEEEATRIRELARRFLQSLYSYVYVFNISIDEIDRTNGFIHVKGVYSSDFAGTKWFDFTLKLDEEYHLIEYKRKIRG